MDGRRVDVGAELNVNGCIMDLNVRLRDFQDVHKRLVELRKEML